GDADVAAGVADGERQQLGGGVLGGEDDVALVLAVGVVGDDDGPAGGDVGDGRFDRVQADVVHRRLPFACRSFSVCLAITSASRCTESPVCLRPRVVASSVAGMRPTVNSSPSIAATVREVPSTVIDPFSTTYLARP